VTDSKSPPLQRVVYVSEIAAEAEQPVPRMLDDILEAARRNNARRGVTGALLHSERRFAQVLEGPPEAVGDIFEAIQCDTRHTGVAVLEVSAPETRAFAAWSMAFVAEPRVEPADLAAADRIVRILRDAIRHTEAAKA
jgi:hypothetical protein